MEILGMPSRAAHGDTTISGLPSRAQQSGLRVVNMAAGQQQVEKPKHGEKVEAPAEEVQAPADNGQEQLAEIDDVLDEIDDVLEDNAEEFVRSYVQKGGQ